MSDADFICHMKRVLKETKESRKWLRFITRCKLANYTKVGNLEDEARQLASIFATIIKNRKANIANERSARASRRT